MAQHLQVANLLPPKCEARDQLEIPMQLYRIPQALLGREAEVQQVLGSLLEHHAAVIWGGPGEGKSSIAMEAGCRLWDSGKCLGGCFTIDCLGVLHFISSRFWPLACLYNSFQIRCCAGGGEEKSAREFLAAQLVPRLTACQVRFADIYMLALCVAWIYQK